jgi:hypothetical protein
MIGGVAMNYMAVGGQVMDYLMKYCDLDKWAKKRKSTRANGINRLVAKLTQMPDDLPVRRELMEQLIYFSLGVANKRIFLSSLTGIERTDEYVDDVQTAALVGMCSGVLKYIPGEFRVVTYIYQSAVRNIQRSDHLQFTPIWIPVDLARLAHYMKYDFRFSPDDDSWKKSFRVSDPERTSHERFDKALPYVSRLVNAEFHDIDDLSQYPGEPTQLYYYDSGISEVEARDHRMLVVKLVLEGIANTQQCSAKDRRLRLQLFALRLLGYESTDIRRILRLDVSRQAVNQRLDKCVDTAWKSLVTYGLDKLCGIPADSISSDARNKLKAVWQRNTHLLLVEGDHVWVRPLLNTLLKRIKSNGKTKSVKQSVEQVNRIKQKVDADGHGVYTHDEGVNHRAVCATLQGVEPHGNQVV